MGHCARGTPRATAQRAHALRRNWIKWLSIICFVFFLLIFSVSCANRKCEYRAGYVCQCDAYGCETAKDCCFDKTVYCEKDDY